ncbi:hypothetical protein N7510_004221 [Penicillium lagena]|uniref:uncharacterized protein n=1 Tax=Penicillium lagena TaxID=94218 RepID=UPI00254169DA|nr:uncharacterized protein N7510_004221 [Penicillium lagena]KAJ5620237.1 hypothetical protein N7510_004221 [Penicillium lagena]
MDSSSDENLALARKRLSKHSGDTSSDRLELPAWIQNINWMVETVSAFFAMISFTVLIVILKHYEGISPTAWPFAGLTLNGLIAALATITRVALSILISSSLGQYKWLWYSQVSPRKMRDIDTFDQASRGVWGSVVLLWRLKGRHLASFAAALTILGLAFDVFAQQIISVEDRVVPMNITSNDQLPRVQRGDKYAPETNLETPPLELVASFYSGLLAGNFTPSNPVCSTGNCTWPTVSSLAVCGGCTDVSSKLISTSHHINKGHTTYKYALPDGLALFRSSIINSKYGGSEQPVFSVLNVSNANESMDRYHAYKSIANDPKNGLVMIAHLESISSMTRNGMQEPGSKPDPSGFSAHECALWFCVQAYNISMTNGNLKQATVGSWSKSKRGSNYNYHFATPPPEFNIPHNASFQISTQVVQILGDSVKSAIGGYVSNSEGNIYMTNMTVSGIYARMNDLDRWIDNYARIMTQSLRSIADSSPVTDTYYLGTAFRDQIYIHVRWAWLAFPAAMIIGTCLLLLVTIWKTDRSPVGPWRNSSLAPFFTETDEKLQLAAQGAMRSYGENLIMAVGRENVRLTDVDGKWKFD